MQRPLRQSLARTLCTVFVATTLSQACSNDLPDYTKVENLRVLGIKATPPEVLVNIQPDPENPFGGVSSEEIVFEALVVDPRGGELAYTWSFCPVESSQACRDYNERRNEASSDIQVLLDILAAPGPTMTAVPSSETAELSPVDWWSQRAVWPYTVGPFRFGAVEGVVGYFAAQAATQSPFDLILGVWPSAILELDKDGEEMRIQKRINLAVGNPKTAALGMASTLPFAVCVEGQNIPGCVPLEDRGPNTNPEFVQVQVAQGRNPEAQFSDIEIAPSGDVAGPVLVARRESVRIKPIFAQELEENRGDPIYRYQVLGADIDTEQIVVDTVEEDVSVSWFVSAGRVQDKITWPIWTKTLDNVFTAPDVPPQDTDGHVTIWMVARDQRGGLEWMAVEALIQ